MDLKHNGLTFMTGVLENSSPLKVQMPTSRTSYISVGRFSDDPYNGCGDHSKLYDAYNHPNYKSNVRTLRYDVPSITAERRISCAERDDTKENFTRLEFTNHQHEDYSEPWINKLDAFREKLRKQHLTYYPRNPSTRYRYSESEKDNTINANIESENIKRRIRARSESEPNDISAMHRWNQPSSDNDFQREKVIKTLHNKNISNITFQQHIKRVREDQHSPPKPKSTFTTTQSKNDSDTMTNGSKRDSTPRICIYNNSPRSPGLLKKPTRFRSSPVLGAPHLNGMRKSKTKSPSPTFRRSPNSSAISIRKAKSATPPPRSALPTERQQPPTSSSVNDFNEEITTNKSDAEDSSFEEDFDAVITDDDSSSDSECGYKTTEYHDRLNSPSVAITTEVADLLTITGRRTEHFVTSLFPNVPPYLSFTTHTDKRSPMPPFLYKILKWKLTSVMPRVVRRVLVNSGFRLIKKTNDWMGTWGKHMKSPCFRTVRSYQKFNHLPGSFKIGRKDACWRNLQSQMVKYGKKEFGFMPKTYIIPQDLKLLRKAWPKYQQRNFKWIIKPPASARGTGIKVINRWSQIPKRKPIIVQRYIEKPLLINGSKFDLRLYVLVTSINPLRVYMYQDGLARFASVKYSDKPDTLSDRYMHLTNYSINKLSSTYSQNEDVNACKGHKWTIKSLWSYLSGRGINTSRLWGALRNLVLRTLLAGESSINAMIKLNVESRYNCFELFGFDVILDSELIPWLLEVNISPSLHSELPLDLHVKGPLVQAVLNTALFHVPPKLSTDQQKFVLAQEGLDGSLCYDKRLYINYLSRAEKMKHNQFTRKILEDRDEYLSTILENLTPDDIRCLITAEDELSRSAPLERIFPSRTTHKYLKYTEIPRYYNRLLDAWEHKYGKNRSEGIQYLQELCEQKIHLQIPPQPIKKDSNAEDNNNKVQLGTQDSGEIDQTEKQETDDKSKIIANNILINNSNNNNINSNTQQNNISRLLDGSKLIVNKDIVMEHPANTTVILNRVMMALKTDSCVL